MKHTRFNLWQWSRRCPLHLVALWLIGSIAAALLIQLLTSALGLSFSIGSPKTGRSVRGLIALVAALVVMANSEQNAGAFGLAIGERWRRQLTLGVAMGAGLIIAQILPAIALGVVDPQFTSASRWFSSTGKAIAGLPIAITGMVTFGGFALGSLRQRLHPQIAALIVSVLFGLLYLGSPIGPGADQRIAGAISMGLLMLVAGHLRLLTGDLAAGAGFLIGVIFVERLTRKAALLAAAGDSQLASFWAPNQLPLQAPALWIGLVLIAIALAVRVRLAPSDLHTKPAPVSTAFLRVYPFATMGALAPIDVWFIQLCRARFRIGLVYLPRAFASIALSLLNTVLTIPERIIVPTLVRNKPVPSPIFILGVHRSGTTHLHNLISQDPQFVSPTSWQVMNPHGFLFSGWLLRPIFAIFAPWKRPMDAVRFGLSAPAEEEFAIANMSGLSPDWSFRLPQLAAHYDRYAYPDQMTDVDRRRWNKLHGRFLRTLTLLNRKRPLLKSPHNTGRLALLADLYPGARFIHIRRNPQDVHRSNLHIARTAHVLFQLQDPHANETYADRFPENYRMMEDRFYRDADARDWSGVVEVRYEDLAADPLGVVRRLYESLDLPWTLAYKNRLNAYIERLGVYQPNRHHTLGDEDRCALETALGPLLERWRQSDEQLQSHQALLASASVGAD